MKKSLLARSEPPTFINGSEVLTTSLTVAKHFGKGHREVLRAIDNSHAGSEFSRCNFAPRDYVDGRGKSQRMYLLTEAGFMRVVFKFTGPDVAPMQDWFCEEFTRMRKALKKIETNKQDSAWLEARAEGVTVRKELCEAIDRLKNYALEDGSKGAAWYFKHITDADDKSLFVNDEENGASRRDQCTSNQLAKLRVLEETQARLIHDLIDAHIHYKEIYKQVKQMAEDFSRIVGKSIRGQDPSALRASHMKALSAAA